MRTTTLVPLALLAMRLHGQVGLLDTSFSGDGKSTFNAGGDTEARAVVIQPDGKILVAGSGGNSPGNGRDFVVARYLVNGELDPSFDGDGIATKGLTGTDEASCIALQPDGKILVGGYYTIGTGGEFLAVVRLNDDGSADTGFGLNGQNFISLDGETPTHSFATGIAVQPNGSIVVSGTVGSGFSQVDLAVVRFDPGGAVDATFGTEGISTQDFIAAPNYGNALALQGDGGIVVVGNIGGGGVVEATWSRFDISGALDPVFGPGGGAYHVICPGDPGAESVANCLSLIPGGKILVGGTCGEEFAVAQVTATGSFDQTFGTDGKMAFDFPDGGDAHAMAVQSDGKILLAGTFNLSPSDLAITRLTADGTPDNTFGVGGWQHYDIEGQVDHGAGMALQSDGRIVVVGKDFSVPTKGSVIRVLNDVGIGMAETPGKVIGMTAFPNPSSGHTELRYTLSRSGKVSCDLLEITGRRVSTLFSSATRNAGSTVEHLDLEQLPAGTYLVELRTGEGVSRTPIVKQ